jgi:putative NADH-flavin reductase
LEKGDAMNAADVARVAKGHDCVISTVRNAPGGTDSAEVAAHCIAVLPSLGIKRMIMVAGAGMTEVSPGLKLYDTEGYPPHVRVGSIRHTEAMNRLLKSDLDFGVFSPAEAIKPGERTGKFRTGIGKLIRDASGKSFISAEDYAIAMLDEIEKPQYVRQNFAIAY